MIIIGLTGGIGSGKTAVSDIFAQLGVPVIDADIVARQVVQTGCPALEEIRREFGDELIDAKGQLKRDMLRDIVFKHPEKRRQLEAILHPLIAQEMHHQASRLNSHYCLFVIPLLFEAHQQSLVDHILVVDAPDALRRQRIKQRSHLDDAQIDAIFASQLSRQERLAQADNIIDNSGDLASLRSQVLDLHRQYSEL